MPPDPERGEAIFQAAIQLAEAARGFFLTQACADDGSLRVRRELLVGICLFRRSVEKTEPGLKHTLGAAIGIVARVFVYRSFSAMRIPVDERDSALVKHQIKKG